MNAEEDTDYNNTCDGEKSSEEKSHSPVSVLSLKSDKSVKIPIQLKAEDSQFKERLLFFRSLERSVSHVPSVLSMKSDKSMKIPIQFKNGDSQFDQSSQERPHSSDPSVWSLKSDKSMKIPIQLKNGYSQFDQSSLEISNSPDPSAIQMKDDSNIPHQRYNAQIPDPKIHQRLKSCMKKKHVYIFEGLAKQGNPTLLNEIYTEIYITEGGNGEISNEHEIKMIEKTLKAAAGATKSIKSNDIFRPLPGQDKPIRTVLTKGVAGIGKTVSVQKFILDWAEEKENQDVQLIFPLPFREINLMKDKKFSLVGLLQTFFMGETSLHLIQNSVVFIFDGLDECRLPLNFHSNEILRDVTKETSVDVLLTNLIMGNLLPSALIWITSRPAAADLIPSECVHRVTEVRGFNDPQKEEYVRKRISDQSLADTIITHLKSSRSLFIMCHIPVFCWISATVLEKMLSEADSGEIPKTLTQMYTHFLKAQINIKDTKYNKKKNTDREMIFKLGKLAFQQLVKGNVIFYEEDLRECGIDVTEASVYSGLCTQIFREEFGWYQGKVFCFVHLSVQEHLAALYVHLSCTNNSINVFDPNTKQSFLSKVMDRFQHNSSEHVSLSALHQRAVDETLQSKNGHLDLFLRFLLGLSVKSHQILLQGLMTLPRNRSDSNEKTVEYIKKKTNTTCPPEKYINLFHCLNELGDRSLVEEIQQYLKSGTLSEVTLSCSLWSALVFVLLTLEEVMDVFELNTFVAKEKITDKVLQYLLPVIKESRSARLDDCNITDKGCGVLASALRSNLRDLDLSENKLGDSGVERLSDGLKDPHCKLQKLNLYHCGVTDEGCAALASALRSNPEHMRKLNFTENKIGDLGLKLLSDVLKDSRCVLEKLRLCKCGVTDEGFAALASALRSNPSHLRELDLSQNKIGDSGVIALSAVLEDPHCRLEKLKLMNCGITEEGFAALTSTLRSNPEHLRDLDLSLNKLNPRVRVSTLQYILEKLINLLTLTI